MSDSVRPHRRQPTRLPRPWDSPGKNAGVGCHSLLQCMKVNSEREVALSCLTLSDPMDCSLPGFSIHGIFQARVLEWGAIAFSTTGTIHGPIRNYNLIFENLCFRNLGTLMYSGSEQDRQGSFLRGLSFQELAIRGLISWENCAFLTVPETRFLSSPVWGFDGAK